MLPCHYFAGMADHIIEQLIFTVCQVQRFAVLIDHIHIGINEQAEMMHALLTLRRFAR
ncbi:hypothetical protein D3C81_2235870 [compost metagenome]